MHNLNREDSRKKLLDIFKAFNFHTALWKNQVPFDLNNKLYQLKNQQSKQCETTQAILLYINILN